MPSLPPRRNRRQQRLLILLAYRRMLPFYGRRLFFLHEAGLLRLFVYQQQLLVGRLLRSVRALGKRVVAPGENPFLAETPNHALARARALQSGYKLGDAITPGQLSYRFGLTLIWWNLVTWMTHPAAFLGAIYSPRRRYIHEHLFFGPRTRAMIIGLERAGLAGLTIANDHMGQSFQLATLAAAMDIPVTYIQHGAVTAHFPPNDFTSLMVWDNETAAIYRHKTNGEITIDPRLKTASITAEPLPERFVLCALSTDYQFWPTVMTLRSLSKAYKGKALLVRFHPSDKRAQIVTTTVRALGSKLIRDVSTRPFMQSFTACELAFITTSSVLRDAVEISPEKAVWLRFLGSPEDVYRVGNLPCAMALSPAELRNILQSSVIASHHKDKQGVAISL